MRRLVFVQTIRENAVRTGRDIVCRRICLVSGGLLLLLGMVGMEEIPESVVAAATAARRCRRVYG